MGWASGTTLECSGSIYLEPSFLRPEALDGNVYEFIVKDILPYMLGDGNGGNG